MVINRWILIMLNDAAIFSKLIRTRHQDS